MQLKSKPPCTEGCVTSAPNNEKLPWLRLACLHQLELPPEPHPAGELCDPQPLPHLQLRIPGPSLALGQPRTSPGRSLPARGSSGASCPAPAPRGGRSGTKRRWGACVASGGDGGVVAAPGGASSSCWRAAAPSRQTPAVCQVVSLKGIELLKTQMIKTLQRVPVCVLCGVGPW